MARLRSSQRAPPPTTIPSDRGILKEKTKNTKQRPAPPSRVVNTDSDDLVKDAPSRGLKRKAPSTQDEEHLYMAGALDVVPGGRAAPHSAARPVQTAGAVDALLKPTRGPPRTTRKPVRTVARTQMLNGLMKSIEETVHQEAAKPAESLEQPPRTANPAPDTTVMSPLSDPTVTPSPPRRGNVRNSVLSVQMPGSALRSHATPGADTSTFALKHFKQRPRQGSMLQIVQQKIASARPSAVHVPSDDDDEDISTTFALGAASDEEDDFLPDAEGTPMQKQPGSSGSKSQSRKRKSVLDSSSSAVERLKAKRSRPSLDTSLERQPESPVHTRSRLAASPTALSGASPQSSPRLRIPQSVAPSQENSVSLNDDADDFDAVIPSTERQEEPQTLRSSSRNRASVSLDGTMAEPASSSPLRSPTGHNHDLTSITADPLTQASPSPSTKRTKAKQKAKAAPISTARLQAFLPKRRERDGRLRQTTKKSIYEISDDETSEEEDDVGSEDELAPRRPLQRRANKKQPEKKIRPRQSKPARKTLAPSKRKQTAKPAQKGVITYGRQTSSDKENEEYESAGEQEDTTVAEVSMYEASKSKELEELKRKFADIDDMELEFESMSGDENHRSSQSWR